MRYIEFEVRPLVMQKDISGVCNVVPGSKFMRAFFFFGPFFLLTKEGVRL